jgi:type II secretory pathway pseudopilin PulG
MVTEADFIQAHYHSSKRPSYQDAKMFPTPQSTDWKGQSQRGKHAPKDCLPNAVIFPTPTAHDGRWPGPELTSTQGFNLKREIEGDGSKGSLNPNFVEWLMGFPKD